MAIGTPVQIGGAADTTSATWAINTTGAVSSGETILLLLSWIQNTSAGTVSATGGSLTWKNKGQNSEVGGSVAYCTALLTAYAPSGLASGTTITVSMTGGGSTLGCGMTVLRVSGLGDPVLMDSDFDYADPGSTADWWGGAGARNVDTTEEALIVAAAIGDGTVTTSVTDSPGTELSDFQDTTNSWTHTTAYRKESSAGSYTLDGNFATGQGFGTATGLYALRFATPPAFPQVVGFNGGQDTANVSGNRSATIPTVSGGILANDLLVCFVAMDGNPSITFPDSGWNSLKNEAGNGSAVRVACAYKRCSGGESGTFNINTSASEGGGWQTYVIRGAHTTTAPAISTGANGSAANSGNPDSLDPANWATEDTLWFAAMGNDANVAVTAGPTNYTTGFANNRWANTNGAGVATGRRENASSSEDPGTFTHAAEDNRAYTVAIRPAPSTTPVEGDALDLKWDLIAEVSGVALDLKWDLVAEVTGTALDLVWDTRSAVDGNALDLLWDLRAGVDGAALDLVWDLPGFAENALTLKWDLAGAVDGNALDLLWDLRNEVDAGALDLTWDTRAAADGNPLDLVWDLAGAVDGSALDLVWDLRAGVDGPALDLVWDLRAPVDATSLDVVWDLAGVVDAAPLECVWDLAASVDAPALDLTWDLVGEVNAGALDLVWDVVGFVDNPLTLVWDLAAEGAVDGDAMRLVWDVQGAVDGTALDLSWDLAGTVDAAAARLIWDLVGTVNGPALRLVWALLVEGGDRWEPTTDDDWPFGVGEEWPSEVVGEWQPSTDLEWPAV